MYFMNGTVQNAHAPAHEWTFTKLAGGSITEAIGAIGTVVLAIVGLAGLDPRLLASIATIVFGAAMLTQGVAYQGAYEMAGRSSTAFFAGVAGIVLGILALFNTAAQTLLPAALIVFGASILLASFGSPSVRSVVGGGSASTFAGVSSWSGGELMVGVAAVTLGILAVIGLSSMVLTLVGLLALGVALLFRGFAAGNAAISMSESTSA
jgi:hypothetical protein